MMQMMLIGSSPVLTPPRTYATWNPSDKSSNITLGGGNLQTTVSGASTCQVRSTIAGALTNKWYWELVITTITSGCIIGISTTGSSVSNYPGSDNFSYGYQSSGNVYNNGNVITTVATYTTGDTIGVALDRIGATLQFFKNNTHLTTISISGLGGGNIFASIGNTTFASGARATANFGATPLTYAPPAGFNAGLYV